MQIYHWRNFFRSLGKSYIQMELGYMWCENRKTLRNEWLYLHYYIYYGQFNFTPWFNTTILSLVLSHLVCDSDLRIEILKKYDKWWLFRNHQIWHIPGHAVQFYSITTQVTSHWWNNNHQYIKLPQPFFSGLRTRCVFLTMLHPWQITNHGIDIVSNTDHSIYTVSNHANTTVETV